MVLLALSQQDEQSAVDTLHVPVGVSGTSTVKGCWGGCWADVNWHIWLCFKSNASEATEQLHVTRLTCICVGVY